MELAEMLAERISRSDAGWFKRRRRNGQWTAWRLPVSGSDDVEVCLYAHYGRLMLRTTGVHGFSRVEDNVDVAVVLAEVIAARGVPV